MEDTLTKLKKDLIEAKIEGTEGWKLFHETLSQYLDIAENQLFDESSISDFCSALSKYEDRDKRSALIVTLIEKEISHPILQNRNFITNELRDSVIENFRDDFFECIYGEGDYKALFKKLERLKNTDFFVSRFFYYSYVVINYKMWSSIHGTLEVIEPPTFRIDDFNIKYSLMSFYKLQELNEKEFKMFTPKNIEYIFRFGKYKGTMLKDVLTLHPSYIEWQILNNLTFSVTYGVLDHILSRYNSTQKDIIIFLTTIKNEFANKGDSLYYDDLPYHIKAEMYDDSEEVQAFYDEAAYDLLTGGGDYDEFNGDWDSLEDDIGQ